MTVGAYLSQEGESTAPQPSLLNGLFPSVVDTEKKAFPDRDSTEEQGNVLGSF